MNKEEHEGERPGHWQGLGDLLGSAVLRVAQLRLQPPQDSCQAAVRQVFSPMPGRNGFNSTKTQKHTQGLSKAGRESTPATSGPGRERQRLQGILGHTAS